MKPPRMGTCYVDVYKYFVYENEIPDAVMVHGILYGKGDLKGWIYGHAWIEIGNGDVVIQPVKQGEDGKTYGLAFVNRSEIFYETYKIDKKMVRKYTKEQAIEMGLKEGNFGPWHDLKLGKKGYVYKP